MPAVTRAQYKQRRERMNQFMDTMVELLKTPVTKNNSSDDVVKVWIQTLNLYNKEMPFMVDADGMNDASIKFIIFILNAYAPYKRTEFPSVSPALFAVFQEELKTALDYSRELMMGYDRRLASNEAIMQTVKEVQHMIKYDVL